jgi:F-type H+-transporting ATPase subunit b
LNSRHNSFWAQVIREPYSQWAEGHIQRIRKVLNDARAEHTGAVKERIDSVGQMKDVVSITKGLFALSKVWWLNIVTDLATQYLLCPSSVKETAVIENNNFVQLQKVQLASELKSVLDSWVRYEQQVKDAEQAELTKTVIEKVVASLKDEKTQKDILTSALVEIEGTCCAP